MSESNNIELISVTFAAGESRLFAMSGNYFEIIDAPGAINVILSSFNGEQRARMSQAAASFYSKGVEFGVIQITSATAQTIRFAYGSGETGTRRSTGAVTISGAVALDSTTLAALEQINVRPESATGFYNTAGALAANTADTIFSAGSNTNGAIVLQASGYDQNSQYASVFSFIAKATAPTSNTDGQTILDIVPKAHRTTDCSASGELNVPQVIPAGFGLFFIGNYATGAAHKRACRYKLL